MTDDTTLHYRAPEGQDRVAVITALTQAGYDADPDRTDHQLIHVPCPDGDRDRVREVIASVRTTALDAGVPMEPGTIRFSDET
jgi:hypothetical protein